MAVRANEFGESFLPPRRRVIVVCGGGPSLLLSLMTGRFRRFLCLTETGRDDWYRIVVIEEQSWQVIARVTN